MSNSMTFGKKLKVLRVSEGLTQAQMASKLGISRRAYIPYEQDKTRPRNKETYLKIAEILNYDIYEMAELLEDGKEKTMPTRECYYSEFVLCGRDNPPTDEECKECMKYHELSKGIIIPNKPVDDKVEYPSHYVEGRKYEPKDVIRDWGLNYNLGCVVKYVSRAGRKDDILQDLKKARQYLTFEIEALEEERDA